MNRRQALGTLLGSSAVTPALRVRELLAKERSVGATAETIYLNPAGGTDTNSGAKDAPLRTLAEAARRVNQSDGTGAVTVILSEGIYAIGETTLIKPERRSFSKAQRLTIRAEVLPDDPDWNIGRMPTLIHTMPLPPTWNGRSDPLGGAANGMLIENSHVTVRGLKILGLPVVETPKPGLKRRLYAIARFNRTLEDLEVAQCLFAGDEICGPLHVGLIAHGNDVAVHHCIFRGFTKDAVVYWTPGSTGHAMRHCLFHGMYSSTVWTAGIAGDFDYRNNVVDSANYVWIYQSGASARADAGGARTQLPSGSQATPQERTHYKVIDSLFTNNKQLAGTGTGARVEFQDIDSSFLELVRTRVSDQPLLWERNESKRNYLHPVAGSEAARIGAGLFQKPSE